VVSKKLVKTVIIGIATNKDIINDEKNQIFKFLSMMGIYIII